ncbi:PaaX family transcriptional regulator [Actinocrinis puniceicyclus]|uniref:PaaX family transcriptional regulator n=1 Tax=Actinocrinis puniceicyclus TaxID=977794 RepID=A0A8J7WSV5_9ACTN|nr:PaaX family transcriptional regulator C-terminal domain-containing protein [Actinocrinis puniceicyclus]MBS2965862.1 PaaX family transcriptional regulator [Actinocrinis puniceicyclus]
MAVSDADQLPTHRPQSLMLTFFGVHMLKRGGAVSSGSVIDVLGRVDVGEDAVRTTLARMVNRGLLERHRRGRRTYFGLTPRAEGVLRDGHDRVWRVGAVNRAWDGTWTVVGFSLPEAWASARHDLRSRLVWAGFGPVQSGMWIAAGRVDVAALVADLGLDAHLRVFHGRSGEPTEAAALIGAAFDLPGIAGRYRAFRERWERADPALPGAGDPLARQLLLHTEWLNLVRQDPHLPADHLPAHWPAARAEELFHVLAGRFDEPAARLAGEVLDCIDAG